MSSELVRNSSAIVEISSELVQFSSELVSTIAELLRISTFRNYKKKAYPKCLNHSKMNHDIIKHMTYRYKKSLSGVPYERWA